MLDFDETSQTNERSSSENNLRMNTSTLDPIVDENKSLSEEEFYDCMGKSLNIDPKIGFKINLGFFSGL